MSIKDLTQKIKGWGSTKTLNLPSLSDDIFLGLIVILVAFGSFGLGRLSKIEDSKTPIRIENSVESPKNSAPQAVNKDSSSQGASVISSIQNGAEGQLVGSSGGTKYHFPWCSGAKTISEANKIYFSSKAEAEARGYTAASNCKGL